MTFHPWRALRRLEHMTLGWHELAGVDAVLFGDLQTVLLHKGLLQAERRCALAHELAHHELGHSGCGDRRSLLRQERAAEAVASRWLIPIEALADVQVWTPYLAEQAEELWVDVPMLRARLERLHPAERGYLCRRLSMKEHTA